MCSQYSLRRASARSSNIRLIPPTRGGTVWDTSRASIRHPGTFTRPGGSAVGAVVLVCILSSRRGQRRQCQEHVGVAPADVWDGVAIPGVELERVAPVGLLHVLE